MEYIDVFIFSMQYVFKQEKKKCSSLGMPN